MKHCNEICHDEPIEDEICTTETKIPKECPIPAQPSEHYKCSDEKPLNSCWSPGVHDVDCPLPNKDGITDFYDINYLQQNNFGLCCFDGCHNTCLNNVTVTICDKILIPNVICEILCTEHFVKECFDVPFKKCWMETIPIETITSKEICGW